MVSQRIKLFGLKPVAGDLVYVEASEDNTAPEENNGKPEEDTNDDKIENKSDKGKFHIANNITNVTK